MSTSGSNLDQLLEDLIQDILARLNLSSLGSCLSTSKHLNHTIKSYALLEYSMKLQAMGMIDNSARSYGDVPLDERLQSLREHRSGGRTSTGDERPVRASLQDSVTFRCLKESPALFLSGRAMNSTSRRCTRRRCLRTKTKLSIGPCFVPQFRTLIFLPMPCLSKKMILLA